MNKLTICALLMMVCGAYSLGSPSVCAGITARSKVCDKKYAELDNFVNGGYAKLKAECGKKKDDIECGHKYKAFEGVVEEAQDNFWTECLPVYEAYSKTCATPEELKEEAAELAAGN